MSQKLTITAVKSIRHDVTKGYRSVRDLGRKDKITAVRYNVVI